MFCLAAIVRFIVWAYFKKVPLSLSVKYSQILQVHLIWAFKSIVIISKRILHNQTQKRKKRSNEPQVLESKLKSIFDPGEIWVNDGVSTPGLLTCSGSSLLVRMPHGSDSSGVQLNCQSWWTWPRTFCTHKSAACGLCVGRPSCGAYIHRRTWMWRYKSGTGNSVYLRASADASLGSRPVWTFSHSGHTGKA